MEVVVMSTWIQPKENMSRQKLLKIAEKEGWQTDASDLIHVTVWPFVNLEEGECNSELGVSKNACGYFEVDPETGLVIGCTAWAGRYAPVIFVVETCERVYGCPWWTEHEMYEYDYDGQERQ